ncbi:integrin alpha [Roseiconus lacunae]|uniref:beta strand repeat-containing protein n=1 Tax=Roseiconus lacunae TaxID=2605694 RepID=UPI00308AD482|nr:integrin alpha [Stieleria sp. HD01]
METKRKVIVESLEGRQLLAADTGFIDSLPTAAEANFGEVVVTEEGREACLAFRAVGAPEGEEVGAGILASPPVAGNVDVSAAIVQQPGPLDVGDPFTSEITFENAGPGSAENTNLTVTFDAGLTGVTWEREVQRTNPATIMVGDITDTTGFAVTGASGIDQSGLPVSGLGDINNDGIDDFAVGVSDALYVIYGDNSGLDDFDLGAIDGTNGFVFNGFGSVGGIVQAQNAGDVNNDGIDDIVLGNSSESPGGLAGAGEAYVIFGSGAFGSSFDVGTLDGTNGFRVPGIAEGSSLGESVDGAGDINNDGFDDVIVGASGSALASVEGEAYVIFGAGSFASGTVSPAGLDGNNGFSIATSETGARLGGSVSGIGDFNGDMIDDLIVSASGSGTGKVYIVFGDGSYGASFDVGSMPTVAGIEISGSQLSSLGLGADLIGDANGDGLADVTVIDGAGVSSNAYVLYGSNSLTGAFDLSSLNGTNGYVLPFDFQVFAGKGGDFNGDGLADAVFANADFVGGFVVFGTDQALPSSVNPLTLDGTNGFKVESSTLEDAAFIGSFAGDVDGDGFDDVIFGAPFSQPSSGFGSFGRSYVINGQGTTLTNGSGDINDTFDLQPGDRVIYRVDATIAAGAMTSTTVDAVATVDPGETDDDPLNNSASAVTTITASDVTPPEVVDVIVSSSAWSNAMIDVVDGSGAGNGLGLSLPGAEQTRPAPWASGIDTIYVVFSEDVGSTFTAANLSFIGTTQADYLPSATVQYGVDGPNVGTITLSQPILRDSLLLQIRDAVTDAAGNALDGEWTDDVSNQSGNGTAGGDLNFRFNVLFGDADGDGFVGTPDIGIVFAALGTSPSDVISSRVDIDADQFIGTPDIGLVFSRLGTGTPAAPPIPAALAGGISPTAIDQAFLEEDLLDGSGEGELGLDLF